MAALETQRARQAAFEKDILEKVTRLETRKDALRRGGQGGAGLRGAGVRVRAARSWAAGRYVVECTGEHGGARVVVARVGDVVVAFNRREPVQPARGSCSRRSTRPA
jgi:hypothetical protein